MLHILYGRAGTGKTAALMEQLRAAAAARQGGQILLVPEQYSHEAERELCRVCGDGVSLYAEVLSFTGLARHVADELGGSRAPLLDQGGRLLCMARALSQIAPRLKLFGGAANRAQMQQTLLSTVDELKTACVTPETLETAAAQCGGYLGEKLSDLALILAAYDAVAANGHADPSDRLTRLSGQIAESAVSRSHVYLDGFSDFTRQELLVLRALLACGAEVTVCLTLDTLDGGNEVFGAERRTARTLLAMAQELGVVHEAAALPARDVGKAQPLRILEQQLFSYTSQTFDDPAPAISLFRADSAAAECELAAAHALELVRDTGCRWRDIAVAVRGFDDYRSALERMCAHYGVPLYFAQRTDLMQKPLPALIAAAYDVITGGWDGDDVIACLRTGLAGLTAAETDLLENYALLWSVRGTMWTRTEPWRQHPDGYGEPYTDEVNARLTEIDRLRREAVHPLLALEATASEATTAAGQAMALADFLEALQLAARLDTLAQQLRADGRAALAAEYEQIWDILVRSLEQFAAILGDTEMDAEGFSRLFLLMLSRYDIGTIPVALDRVTAGDFDRMRRRGVRHLIVLGASDDRIPRAGEPGGVFSADERRALLELDLDLGGGHDDDLWREYSLVGSCISLPSDTLTVVCPAFDHAGEPVRASFLMTRITQLFGTPVQGVDPAALKCSAPAPALELAARCLHGAGDARAAAANAYFRETQPETLAYLQKSATLLRGSLSPESVNRLYGQKLRLSASRADRFASCRYAYFLQYGLKAKARQPAAFSPPEIGTFFHFILQHVADDVTAAGGFAAVTDERLGAITDRYVQQYIHETLNDFQEKTQRFIYLFRRLSRSVQQVVADMAQELRASDFQPLDFELDFSDPDAIAPVKLSDGETTLTMSGVADRVDGWLHDGKLYLRVIDYKTGKKAFSLSDVWYGMGLQMLLYLFALERTGQARYGHEIVPAGVLYVPARDVLVSAPGDLSDGEIAQKRAAQVRRSGLILSDPDVLNAMEHGDAKRYLPVRFNRSGEAAGDALASAEQLGALSRHIQQTLLELARELRGGSITADPYYRSQQDTACTYCDYLDICHFAPGADGDRHRVLEKLPATKVWHALEGGESHG